MYAVKDIRLDPLISITKEPFYCQNEKNLYFCCGDVLNGNYHGSSRDFFYKFPD